MPGGFDQQPINILAGSYVLPADVPAAIGQGDSRAGANILARMFSSGPYGIALPHRARGGATPRVMKIRAAGGSYVVPPSVVRKIGEGDLNNGVLALDAFVRKMRRAAEAHRKIARRDAV